MALAARAGTKRVEYARGRPRAAVYRAGNAFAPAALLNGFVANERFLFEAPPQALNR